MKNPIVKLREDWAVSPANPKTWSVEEWKRDQWETRVFFGFIFGLILGSAFFVFLIPLVLLVVLHEWSSSHHIKKLELIE